MTAPRRQFCAPRRHVAMPVPANPPPPVTLCPPPCPPPPPPSNNMQSLPPTCIAFTTSRSAPVSVRVVTHAGGALRGVIERTDGSGSLYSNATVLALTCSATVYDSIRQHTSAYGSIRQHTSAYVLTCSATATLTSSRRHAKGAVCGTEHASDVSEIHSCAPHLLMPTVTFQRLSGVYI